MPEKHQRVAERLTPAAIPARSHLQAITPLWMILIPLLLLSVCPVTGGSAPTSRSVSAYGSCRKLELTGEVKAGQQWSAPIGSGWVFRVLPIAPSGRGYTGWDLAVDAPGMTGYPDALLLGTPPYGSINQREIGTTFGLRAQDAIGWEPRRFHFLASAQAVAHARALYSQVMISPSTSEAAANELVSLATVARGNRVGYGQIKIVDARLTAGTADPAPYAREWAAHLHQVPHTVIQPDQQSGIAPTPRGELQSMRFALTLWLPGKWDASGAASATTASLCVP